MDGARDANPAPGFGEHPEHRVTIARTGERLRAGFRGRVVADSRHALVVHETGYAPVVYFPAADVRQDWLKPTDRRTYCPFKGHARYWTLLVDGHRADNAVWSYPRPYDEAGALRGHYAFYAGRIDGVDVPA